MFPILIFRGNTCPSQEIQVMTPECQVSILLVHAFCQDCTLRNKMIHTSDNAIEDQNTITLKKKKVIMYQFHKTLLRVSIFYFICLVFWVHLGNNSD